MPPPHYYVIALLNQVFTILQMEKLPLSVLFSFLFFETKTRITSFCSTQCEHQKAPYILAPMDCRCLASEMARGLDGFVSSVSKYGRSSSAAL